MSSTRSHSQSETTFVWARARIRPAASWIGSSTGRLNATTVEARSTSSSKRHSTASTSGGRAAQVFDHHLVPRQTRVGPVLLDAPGGEAVGLAVGVLVDRDEHRTGAVPPALAVAQAQLPVLGGLRVIAPARSRRHRSYAAWSGPDGLAAREQPGPARCRRLGSRPEGGPGGVDLEHHVADREPVAEAAVDAALGRGEDGERLTAVDDVVELALHELAEDAAPAVGRR